MIQAALLWKVMRQLKLRGVLGLQAPTFGLLLRVAQSDQDRNHEVESVLSLKSEDDRERS